MKAVVIPEKDIRQFIDLITSLIKMEIAEEMGEGSLLDPHPSMGEAQLEAFLQKRTVDFPWK